MRANMRASVSQAIKKFDYRGLSKAVESSLSLANRTIHADCGHFDFSCPVLFTWTNLEAFKSPNH